jgi:hypothetical protein
LSTVFVSPWGGGGDYLDVIQGVNIKSELLKEKGKTTDKDRIEVKRVRYWWMSCREKI